jgi:hypothetical protein
LDAMVKGEANISVGHDERGLVLEVRAHPLEVDATDRDRMVAEWREWVEAPRLTGGQASIIPLRLLSRLSEMGGCQFEVFLDEAWPVVRLTLSAA